MNIYTSYFANLRNIPANILPVSISRFPPKWYRGERLDKLAPAAKLLWKSKQGKVSEGEYTDEYITGIENIFSPGSLFDELEELYSGSAIALLCFEKRGEFCHRRLLARWLEEGLGIVVPEL